MVEMSLMVGIVVALTEMVKQMQWMPIRFIPLLNLCLGVIMCLVYDQSTPKEAVFKGLVVGLSASGLFSSGKNIMKDGKA